MTQPRLSTVIKEFVVPERTQPQRLDQYLLHRGLHRSRTFLQKMIRQGEVKVNGQVAKPSQFVHIGDRIYVRIPAPTPLEIHPEPIPLNILYEDPSLLVVNKPPGLVVHPAPGHDTGTLVNALLYHCRDLSGIGGRERPGIVHRLDKGTSGLLLVAKTDEAHRNLSRQFASHSISRTYLALVRGKMKKPPEKIELAIGRDRFERKKISPKTAHPKQAVTFLSIIERFSAATLVAARPKTGRTHQIRVHLASIGHPLLGDRVYGGSKAGSLMEVSIERPMLHAHRLGFTHPVSHNFFEFETPIPEDMEHLIGLLRSAEG
jgi:23S rRNA pseudouridine1911/1915/1917 synthase